MLNTAFIDEISKRINALVESTPASEVEKNVHALLRGIFTKMDLVTREEFEVQSQVLLQARNKLSALEQKLTELEAQLSERE